MRGFGVMQMSVETPTLVLPHVTTRASARNPLPHLKGGITVHTSQHCY